MVQDIDYLGQQCLAQGMLPTDYYDRSSLSDLQDVLKAKSRKDRVQDPMQLLIQAGLR